MSFCEIAELATTAFIFESTVMGCQLLERALQVCQPKICVLGYATTSLDFPLSQVERADVAVISASLQEAPQAALELVKMLRQSTGVRPVMLLDENDERLLIESFRSGALGVIERDKTCEMLCKCLRCVHSGQVWASSAQLRCLLEALASGLPKPPTESRARSALTEREDQIAFLVAQGLRNKDIASRLGLSEHTVKNYIFHIFEKLGARSRSELVLYSTERHNQKPNFTGKTPESEP